ncbi:hypothetical protein [Ancylobacter rudongensis]|uniref:Uncharacterized protein n=1 Tax=Ancylobacter rudongensis TaxID=177413 RepID=A0A1G4UQG3_9HYPH|nr:hypothetical protein [Ancylobacter rudongensis]SCW95898.1 hypothetical protein SAMN05660859_0142 [Ancylobacter rudongensis]
MIERRITTGPTPPQNAERHDSLKEIAGRLVKLSYRDMLTFAALVSQDKPSGEVAQSLLVAADRLLKD